MPVDTGSTMYESPGLLRTACYSNPPRMRNPHYRSTLRFGRRWANVPPDVQRLLAYTG